MPLQLADRFVSTERQRQSVAPFFLICLLATVSVLFSPVTLARTTCNVEVARVVSVQGSVERLDSEGGVNRADSDSSSGVWLSLLSGQVLCAGDQIRVAANSRAALHLSNNTFLRLSENSLVRFPVEESSDSFWIELKRGIGHFISRIKNRFEVSTPYVNAAIEGTEFVIDLRQDRGFVSVIEGFVIADIAGERQELRNGEGIITDSTSGFRKLDVIPRESVSWSVYFPPLLTFQELSVLTNEETRNQLAVAIKESEAGRIERALVVLSQDFTGADSEAMRIAKASYYLQAGQHIRAEKLLNRNFERHEYQALAFALRTMISAIFGLAGEAIQLAEKALASDNQSAAVYLAYSYAGQASHNLYNALLQAEYATKVSTDNPIAWARLGEIHLATGNLESADRALNTALELNPERPETLTLAGFVKLMSLQRQEGINLLQQSLLLDSHNPDTRLGLGLAYTSEGDIEEGRVQLEYALLLNPASSLLRSYLGRVYFGEKRDELAGTQWELATQLDPNDPVPHFYQGVQHLFQNNPVAALNSLEKSKELNARRGTVRSESLLQSDAATYSATLGRVYTELGFDQAVVEEAAEALMLDPTNSDGHRLLADRYSTLPRHESASTSELLQAQIWQPLTAYPIPPQLTESDTLLIEGLGPQRPGLNEYHSLFTRDGIYASVNAIGGGDSTLGEDVVVSILEGPVALSLGQFHYESDGFRENFEQEEDIYNGFLQWQFSPKLTFQFEARKHDRESKDFELEALVPIQEDANRDREILTKRLGARYHFSEEHSFVFSAIRQNYEEVLEIPASEIISDEERTPLMLEFQHTFINDLWFTQFGLGHITLKPETNIDSGIFRINANQDVQQKYAYFDGGFKIDRNFHFVTGIAYDWFSEKNSSVLVVSDLPFPDPKERSDKRQWSPKLGAIYTPNKSITLRFSAYRAFERDFVADQAMGATQVAGFNMIYDDITASDIKAYTTAVDFELDNDSRAGIETLYRDIDVPISIGEVVNPKRKDTIARIYAYHEFNDLVTFSSEYLFEDLDYEYKEGGIRGELYRTKTHEFPLRLAFFFGDRYKLDFESTYINQELHGAYAENTKRQFDESGWITSLGFGIKLPNRMGEIQFGIENLSNEKKEFINNRSDATSIRYYPERFIFSRIHLSL